VTVILRGDRFPCCSAGETVYTSSLCFSLPTALDAENGTVTAWEDHRRKETDMERMVTRTAPYLYAVLRIIGALLYACHGAQKLLGLFGGVRGGTVPLLSLPGLAGVIELGAGLAHRRWGPDPASGVPGQWGNGVRLLALARPAGLLAHPQWGRISRPELLPLPLHR
jgi:hypothetical protein